MKRSRGNRYAVIAAATAVAAVAAGITAPTRAATVTWNATTPPGNWSDAANWTGGTGIPVAADSVVFGNTGAAAAQGTVTNVVNSNFTITGLNYNQQSDLAGDPKFHTTQIDSGVTLTVNGNPSTGILQVGSQNNAATAFSVYTSFTGPGTLTLNNTSASVDIRQGSIAGSFSGRATLDLSALSNFNATVSNFRVGQGEGSTTNFNRATGTAILAVTNNITAGTFTVAFGSASTGGTSQLTLGQTNNINANTFQVGIRKSTGNVNFNPALSGAVFRLRAQNGTGRASLLIGQTQANESTTSNGIGTIDLTAAAGTRGSGSIDALVSNLNMGRSNGNVGTNQGRGTGRLSYEAGTLDANDVLLGEASSTAGTGTGVGQGTLEVFGTGSLIVNNNVTLAKQSATPQPAAPIGILTIGNATSTTANARIFGDIIDGGGASTVNVVNSSLTARKVGVTSAAPIDTLNLNNGKLVLTLDTSAAAANITTINADGANSLGLNVSGTVAAGIYPIIDYGTIGGAGGVASIALGKLPARMNATLQDSGSTLDLNVTSYDSPKWKGNGSSNWTVGGPQNWQLVTAGTATAYEENLAVYATADNVLFDDSADTGNVNVVGTVSPGSFTVNNAALNYAFGGSGAIAGNVGIVKTGAGSLTIANSGGNAIGPVSIGAGGTVRIGDNTTAGGGIGTYGSISNAATLELSPAAGDSLNLGGSAISGAGALKHTGAGTTTLAGSNSYTGSTDITAGTVVVTGNNSFGPITAGSAAVNISGTGAIDLVGAPAALDFGTNKVFNVAGSGTGGAGVIRNSGTTAIQNAFEKINLTDDATINLNARVDLRGTDSVRGNLSLNGKTLTKIGTGQFTIVRSDVTDGNINIDAGSLRFETSTNVPAGSGVINVAPGATLQLFQNSGDISRQIVLNGGIINDVNQTHTATINSPITINSDSTFDLTNSTGMTFAGAINGAGGLTKTGNGTMALSGTSSFAGKLAASDGRLDLLSNQVGSSSLEASGDAVIELANDSSANKVIKTGAVSITGTAKVDLKNNKLIATEPAGTTTAGVYSGVQGAVQSASNFGAWDGPGLTTSMPDAVAGLTTIGVATGEQVRGLGPTDTDTFAGQTISGASTIAMYTYAGDANLDGTIDGGDYGIIDNFAQIPGADGYANGDFNYDGVIDGGDYGIIDNNAQAQGAPFPTSGAIASSTGGATLSGVTAVPEPASLSVLALGAGVLLGRRRRRRGPGRGN